MLPYESMKIKIINSDKNAYTETNFSCAECDTYNICKGLNNRCPIIRQLREQESNTAYDITPKGACLEIKPRRDKFTSVMTMVRDTIRAHTK